MMTGDGHEPGASERHLAQLIDRALALADALGLTTAAIKLDEARTLVDGVGAAPVDLADLELMLGDSEPRAARPLPHGANVAELFPPVSLEQLLNEHDALDAQRLELMRAVEGKPAPRATARRLKRFAAEIAAHRVTERRAVYGPLLALEARSEVEPGLTVQDIVGEIEDDWSGYIGKWDAAAIAADWTGFALETHRILTRAGERLRLENQIIYPLALRKGMIRLRAKAG